MASDRRIQRRSKDGFVSATGMFKIACPWALQAEEKAEREYLKTKEATSQDEVAGNVWIAPEFGEHKIRIHWKDTEADPQPQPSI